MIGIGTPKSQSKIPRPMISSIVCTETKPSGPRFVPEGETDSPRSAHVWEMPYAEYQPRRGLQPKGAR
jgi:hypothetical protein